MAIVLSHEEQKLFEGQPHGFPFGDFDVEDVMLPEGDDMGIPSDDEEAGKEEADLPQESGFGSVIVVDNLPQVPPEKFDKLNSILTKILSGAGRIREGGLHHPVDADTQAGAALPPARRLACRFLPPPSERSEPRGGAGPGGVASVGARRALLAPPPARRRAQRRAGAGGAQAKPAAHRVPARHCALKQVSKGFYFVEYENPQQAHAALEALNGYQLDRSHTFRACPFDELERLRRGRGAAGGARSGVRALRRAAAARRRAACPARAGASRPLATPLLPRSRRCSKVPDEYAEPEARPYQPSENLQWWLNDKRGRDQFVTRYGDETDVYWNDPARQQGDMVYHRSFWSDAYVEWSPHGAFLATVHRQGVQLWGGPEFVRLGRVAHPGVQVRRSGGAAPASPPTPGAAPLAAAPSLLTPAPRAARCHPCQSRQRIALSPDERYLLTFSEFPDNRGRPMFAAKVSELRTGKELRLFDGPQAEYAVGAARRPDGGLAWPAFKWGGGAEGGRFLAHMKQGALAIYDAAQGMAMLDKKSVKLEAVQAFEWSPADPLLCAYQGEQGNLPARVVLIRHVVGSRERASRGAPDKSEVRGKNLFSVAGIVMTWHPQGDYVAVQVDKWTKTRKSTTTNFEIFSLREKDTPIDMLELPNRSEKVLQLAWEPRGHKIAVLHGEGSRPTASVYSMRDTKATARGAALLHSMPNKTATSLHWSPAGRFLLLAGLTGGMNGALEWWDCEDPSAPSGVGLVSANEHFMANDVAWDPTGRYLATILSWRPRPPSLLTEEAQREIARGLKKYSKRYEEEDEAADTELMAERERVMDAWRKWHASKAEFVEAERRGDAELLGDRVKIIEDFKLVETEVTVVVDTKEEPARLP
eukprot:scaffold10.g2372.t1